MMKFTKQFKVYIRGDLWTISRVSKRVFDAYCPDVLALTEYHHPKNMRIISFRSPRISKDTIAHELMHAYLSYHDFSKKSYGNIEEKVCEVIGKNHKKIYKLTNYIYNKLRK